VALQITSSNQKRSPVHPMYFKIQIDTAFASTSINFNLEFSKNEDRTNFQIIPKFKESNDPNSFQKVDETDCIKF
jgi:hypothetical protein